MPEEHRVFYTHSIPFLPLTTRDATGRPWASLVSGGSINEKGPGFVKSPSETELVMRLDLWEGDPILDNLDLFDEESGREESVSIAGLGIDFATRRRNIFSGWIERVTKVDLCPNSRFVYTRINQAFGYVLPHSSRFVGLTMRIGTVQSISMFESLTRIHIRLPI